MAHLSMEARIRFPVAPSSPSKSRSHTETHQLGKSGAKKPLFTSADGTHLELSVNETVEKQLDRLFFCLF